MVDNLFSQSGFPRMPNTPSGGFALEIPPAEQRIGPEIGSPENDAADWAGQQHGMDTCAIRCQEYIITQYTGKDPGEAALVKEAQLHGWYHPGGGTAPKDLGKLLEEHNISVSRYEHANVFELANELARGHKVIVGVRAENLWHNHPVLHEISEKLRLHNADHAVVVSGIDTSNPANIQVIVSDPGTGEAVAHYPLQQFTDAWKNSDFFMVATKEPPPETAHLPEMAHFDYGSGHIDEVWGQSFDAFSALEPRSDTSRSAHVWVPLEDSVSVKFTDQGNSSTDGSDTFDHSSGLSQSNLNGLGDIHHG